MQNIKRTKYIRVY